MARPLAFDPTEKLQKAMMLFWQKGYEATSVQDLVDEMEINRFSLYNTFGDKQSLFAKAIDLYVEQVFNLSLLALQPASNGLKQLHVYLDALSAVLQQEEPSVTGCLLQNSLLEGGVEDPQVREHIQRVLRRLRDALEQVLEAAKGMSELKSNTAVSDLADYLLVQVQGMIVLHGAGMCDEAMNAMAVLRSQVDNF